MKIKEFLELTTAKQKKVKNDELQKLCADNKIPFETDNNKQTLIDNIKAHKPEPPAEEPPTEESSKEETPADEQATETETPEEMETRIRGEIREEVEAQFRSELRDEMYPEIRSEVELQIAEAQAKKEANEEPAKEEAPVEETTEEPAKEESPKEKASAEEKEHEAKVRKLMGGFYTGDLVKYECHGQNYENLKKTTIAFADESHLIINHEKGNYHNSMPRHLHSVLKADGRFVAAMPSELITL